MAQEFEDLNKAYTSGKEAHDFIQSHIKEIFSIQHQILEYTSQLNTLSFRRMQLVHEAEIFQGFSLDGLFEDVDSQIQDVRNKIEALKKDKLYRSKQEIQDASTDLDFYLDLANTNPDFQLEIRNEIIAQSNVKINETTNQIGFHKASIALVKLINEQAEADPSFKDIISSIDSAKDSLKDSISFEDILKNFKNKHNDPRTIANAEALISNNKNEIASSTKALEEKAEELKKYISEHRDDFGLPASLGELNFNDENLPLYIVSMYTDATSNLGLDDIVQSHTEQMNALQERIIELQNYVSYANQDIQNISNSQAVQNPQATPDPQTVPDPQATPDPQTVPDPNATPVKTERDFQALYVSLKDKVKNLFKTLTKGVKNWLQDKPFFDKNGQGQAGPQTQGQAVSQSQAPQSQGQPAVQPQATQTQASQTQGQAGPQTKPTPEVVDTANNFKDAYKTEIGQEEYKRVIDNYKKRMAQQSQQQNQTPSDPSR